MSFFSNIMNAVSENLISGGAYYLIVKGILVTAAIAVTAWIVAAVFGSLISLVMSYEKKVVSGIGRAISFILRSTPCLLMILLFYYVFFGTSSKLTIIIMGAAIGLYGAGHLAEIFTAAVKKQQERLSPGMSEKLEKVYFTTVIPQAFEESLFQIKRLSIQLLQWTTVAGYISVNDLTEVMYGIGQRTMYPFFSIFFSILLYIIAAILIELVFRFIRKKLSANSKESSK